MSILHSFNLNKDPAKEILGFNRSEEVEYCKFSSFKGRFICILLVPLHLIALPFKPTLYILKSLARLVAAVSLPIIIIIQGLLIRDKQCLIKALNEFTDFSSKAYELVYIAGIAVAVQSVNIIKAVMGIFHPKAYFKNPVLLNSNNLVPAPIEIISNRLSTEKPKSVIPAAAISAGLSSGNIVSGIDIKGSISEVELAKIPKKIKKEEKSSSRQENSTTIAVPIITKEYIENVILEESNTKVTNDNGRTTLEEEVFFD